MLCRQSLDATNVGVVLQHCARQRLSVLKRGHRLGLDWCSASLFDQWAPRKGSTTTAAGVVYCRLVLVGKSSTRAMRVGTSFLDEVGQCALSRQRLGLDRETGNHANGWLATPSFHCGLRRRHPHPHPAPTSPLLAPPLGHHRPARSHATSYSYTLAYVESPLVFWCPARGSDWSRQRPGLESVLGLVYFWAGLVYCWAGLVYCRAGLVDF